MSLTYEQEDVLQDLLKDYEFYRKEINILAKEISKEGKTLETNAGKTLMQNPKIKTLNEFTKNMHATLDRIQKMILTEGGGVDEMEDFLRKRNKK